MNRIIVTELNGDVSAHFIGCDTPEEYLEEGSGEKVLAFLKFPADGEEETSTTDAISALVNLHTYEDDSICRTLERLLTQVFEAGRDHQRKLAPVADSPM